MKLKKIIDWLDKVLEPEKFKDVSNNGIQVARSTDEIKTVAFAVDASVESVKGAAIAGAELLVVHHGISWGGGIERLTGGVYNVVKAAMDSDIAIFASHLPLDANKRCGNNWEIARSLKLSKIEKAFNYHGNVIGVKGVGPDGIVYGICSGGAGDFAAEAKDLGCDIFITGEANWGDVIAAENVNMPMLCCGHYESEVFGVAALAREMAKDLGINTVFIERGDESEKEPE
jgi:putative NIF3 family GTP cyclohydrolase 1 type 2